MSVINQMLRDLDVQQQTGAQQGTNQNTLPPSRGFRVVHVMVLVLVIALGYCLWLLTQLTHSATTPVVSQTAEDMPTEYASTQDKGIETEAIAPDQATKQATKQATTEQATAEQVVMVAEPVAVTELQPEPESALSVNPTEDANSQQVKTTQSGAAQNKTVVESVTENIQTPVVAATPVITKPKTEAVAPLKAASQPVVTEPKAAASMQVAIQHQSQAEQFQQLMRKAQQAGSAKLKADLYSQALAVQPDSLEARLALANALDAQQQQSAAIQLLDAGLGFDDSRHLLRVRLAQLIYQQGQMTRASELLDVIPEATSNPEYHQLAGSIYTELKQPLVAQAHYRWLVRHHPEDGRWWLGLALNYEQMRDEQAARSAYQSALALASLSPKALMFVQQRLQELEY